MSQLTEFYSEVGPDSEGRYLGDILEMDDEWFETCHDYIQWLFPLMEPSNFNPDAPIMTQEDIEFLGHPMNFPSICDSVIRFMAFLGMRWDWKEESTNYFAVEEDTRQFSNFIPFNHNHLRVTRMLTFLNLIGQIDLAKGILSGIEDGAALLNLEINPKSMEYWKEAISEG